MNDIIFPEYDFMTYKKHSLSLLTPTSNNHHSVLCVCEFGEIMVVFFKDNTYKYTITFSDLFYIA